MREIARVLRPGGRCLVTFFLLNEQSRALIRSRRGAPDFRFTLDERCLTVSAGDPESAIAYDERYVVELFRAQGLLMSTPHPGSWCGRGEFLSLQDIAIAHKG